MTQMYSWDLGRRWRENRARWCCIATLLFLVLITITPRIHHSPNHHIFADMRNLIGVPNTLNVITNFPFLIVGIVGLAISVYGNCFRIGSKGEVWGWAFFYSGIAGLAFGSAYYHLDPGDDRAVWDQLPMLVSISSLSSVLVMERVDGQMGITCLFSLLIFALMSIQYERVFDDLRLCMIAQFVPCLAIPAMILLLPPKNTHSRYWFLVAGLYLLARFEAIYDKKVYRVNHYVISGHSLEHLCLAAIPILLSIMLCFRNIKIQRDSSVGSTGARLYRDEDFRSPGKGFTRAEHK